MRGGASVTAMPWGFWALDALIGPVQHASVQHAPASLVLGLAVVVAALIVVAAAGLPALVPAAVPALRAYTRRADGRERPRLLDPDAAGRPRPRAPTPGPAAA